MHTESDAAGRVEGVEGAGREDTNLDPVIDMGKPKHDFLIVGVGASAGGIGALGTFFDNIPAEPGMAFVVIIHLSPEYASNLANVLQSHTSMTVEQVNSQITVRPNHIYVIPPGKQLFMADDHIGVADPDRPRGERVPIDSFFRTLAEAQGDCAAAVVLSGTGADGTVGLPRVKEMGGVTFVQDPAEAEYGQMPANAIATGFADFVLPVAEIGTQLLQFWNNRHSIVLPVAQTRTPDSDQARDDHLQSILNLLRVRTGHNFAAYKRTTVLRRIERRMQVNETPDLGSYATFLSTHSSELHFLLRDLLISVTNFFRDQVVWETLASNIIPRLFSGKSDTDQVRVWVAGCATGEEAYSVAILLSEYASQFSNPPKLQVFATDLDERAISVAREGSYPESIEGDVSAERLRRYFTHSNERYRVRKELRDLVLFAAHNVLKDPPFSRLDMVSCRNLLIYLNRDAQQELLRVFHFALKPEGYLLMGMSESAEFTPQLYATIDKKQHIYTRRPVPLSAQPIPKAPAPELDVSRVHIEAGGTTRERPSSFGELHQDLLERYAPPSVIVNESYDIVHLSKRAGRYLQLVGGDPTHNLTRLVRPELRLDLRSALYTAIQRGKANQTRRRRVMIDGVDTLVRVIVQPVDEPDSMRGYALVIFDEIEEAGDDENRPLTEPGLEPVAQQLEEELYFTRNQLRVTVEQYETTVEELRASNEELQATNEEMRSTTEELETGKEEMQAINEEISTINQELKLKVDEVTRANSDLQNLMVSTDIATLFLNRDLKVSRYTPGAQRVFNIIPTDINRPLAHITHKLNYNSLVDNAEQVLQHLQPITAEMQANSGEWYYVRVLPYRTVDDRIDGVVITFVDISERKHAEEELRASEERLRRALDIETVGVVFYKAGGVLTGSNRAFLNMTGLSSDSMQKGEARWNQLTAAGPHEENGEAQEASEHLPFIGRSAPYEKEYVRPDGTHWWGLFTSTLLNSEEAAGFIVDITERKRSEEALLLSKADFQTIADLVPDLLCRTDQDGNPLWYNERWLSYTGQTLEQAKGVSALEVVHPDDRAKARRGFQEAVISGQEHESEVRIKGADGQYRWFLVRAQSVRDETGNITQWIGAATDIEHQRKEREALEIRVQERTRELEIANHDLLVRTEQQEKTEAARSALLRKLLSAQEDEQRRISRELHDQLGQLLTGLKFILESTARGRRADGLANLGEAVEIVDQLTESVSALSLALRPPVLDDMGLLPALTLLVKEFSTRTGMNINYSHSGLQRRFDPNIETVVYRVVQEGLTNVARHSGAKDVSVQVLEHEGSITIDIDDDGNGFDVSSVGASLGLSGMKERITLAGGEIVIDSDAGEGTSLHIELPTGPAGDSGRK